MNHPTAVRKNANLQPISGKPTLQWEVGRLKMYSLYWMKTRVFRRQVSLLECTYPNVILFLTHAFMNKTNHLSSSTENIPK